MKDTLKTILISALSTSLALIIVDEVRRRREKAKQLKQ